MVIKHVVTVPVRWLIWGRHSYFKTFLPLTPLFIITPTQPFFHYQVTKILKKTSCLLMQYPVSLMRETVKLGVSLVKAELPSLRFPPPLELLWFLLLLLFLPSLHLDRHLINHPASWYHPCCRSPAQHQNRHPLPSPGRHLPAQRKQEENARPMKLRAGHHQRPKRIIRPPLLQRLQGHIALPEILQFRMLHHLTNPIIGTNVLGFPVSCRCRLLAKINIRISRTIPIPVVHLDPEVVAVEDKGTLGRTLVHLLFAQSPRRSLVLIRPRQEEVSRKPPYRFPLLSPPMHHPYHSGRRDITCATLGSHREFSRHPGRYRFLLQGKARLDTFRNGSGGKRRTGPTQSDGRMVEVVHCMLGFSFLVSCCFQFGGLPGCWSVYQRRDGSGMQIPWRRGSC